jgi:2,4-dienoyl-CoA reductase-like NADH-dependent reductase (Old Yellow Enzyme family)
MSVLFQPVTIGTLALKNRFVRSATQDYLGHPDGTISTPELQLYQELAAGGVGLILTGHAYVQHPLGRASVNQNAPLCANMNETPTPKEFRVEGETG